MCGIAGFYSLKADKSMEDRQNIGQAMEAAITHRGPDSGDIWLDTDSSLVLGHRRLAIIDLSAGGRQPMTSHSGRYIVTYNGEIYNYQELQSELEGAGYNFKSRSDTEVMLAAFEHWGIHQALQKLNGMFAIVLWDKQQQQLHLIRDRFGKKPLYVGWAGNDFIFGSELKSLHAHPDFKAKIDRDALSLYMRYGYLHAPHSIFTNVWQLLPAARMVLDFKDLQGGEDLSKMMQTYWSLKEVSDVGRSNITHQSDDEVIHEFEGLLGKAVSQRMISDVPFGAFLSGGIDSSSVVALMQKNATSKIKTFSIGFKEEGFNEAEYAKAIAKHLETDHQEFYVSGQDALDVVPKLPEIYDEPFADQSQIPTYLISKLARSHVTVAITGDGGDEILAGYDRHTKIAALWNKISWIPYPVRKVLFTTFGLTPESFFQTLRSNNPNFGAQVKRALKLMGLKDAQSIYDALVSTGASQSVVMMGKTPNTVLKDKAYWPENLNFAEQMMFGDMLSYRPNDLMVKADRASMAVALELRAPLMDYKLAEFSWTLPHHMKVRNGQGKWLLRQVLKRHVPEALYERPKMGFSIPLSSWLRGPLKSWGDDLLNRERLEKQNLFNADILLKEWHDFQRGKQIGQGFQTVPKHLWSALMFQAWYDRWMV